jgi:hypothetical protein
VKGTAENLLQKLVALGFLPEMPDGDVLAQVREEQGDEASAQSLTGQALELSGLLLSIDMEVDEYPVRYDALLHQLAAISRGGFNPTHVHQFFEGNPDALEDSAPEAIYAPYTFTFVLDGTRHEFTFSGTGAWYNADPFMREINGILKKAKHRGRFAGPDCSYYQDRHYIFAERRAARKVASILGWKLDRSIGS